jgi:hypothetical protein
MSWHCRSDSTPTNTSSATNGMEGPQLQRPQQQARQQQPHQQQLTQLLPQPVHS